jgi:cardiolipin synthase
MAVMFLTMWDYTRGVREDYEKFRPSDLSDSRITGSGFIQPYTDSPLDDEPVGETVYLNLISKAERYVYITTPYLIIEDSMKTALCNAAKSGVDVRIMTPGIPDKATVYELTRAHYEPLLEAGVHIYEYTPGFLHAKNFAVDDRYATVGSINLDYRSLFLHFENGVWLCDTPAVIDVKADFLATLKECRQITLAQCFELPVRRRILRSVLRVFAPLL